MESSLAARRAGIAHAIIATTSSITPTPGSVIYFDAPCIAKCYLNEPGADRVREIAHGADGLASCELARLELPRSSSNTSESAT